MSHPNQPPGSAAAQYAGYASFYGTPQGHAPPRPQGFAPMAGPPRPGMMRGPPPPRGAFMNAPRPMAHQQQYAPQGFPRGPPPPRPGTMPPPPGSAVGRISPGAVAPAWQWSNGRNAKNTTVISAPPRAFVPPRAFQQPQAPPPAAKPVATPGSEKWPEALHDYVKRAFGRCKGPSDQVLTQNALKDLITNAIMANNLWTRNWTAEPLPTLVGDMKPAQMQANMTKPAPIGQHQFRPPQKKQAAQNFMPLNHTMTMEMTGKRKSPSSKEEIEDFQRKNQRRQRFIKEQQELARPVPPTVDTKKLQVLTLDGALDLEAMVIKGTSQTVEKEYLRLTSAPHPSTVRPEPVLKRALVLIRNKWKKRECDYKYACSQLKSIRQDCTVQHIKNEFTVLVYESHARVALESGDINEFNQCQTQLHELYEKVPSAGQVLEFLSYRILYCIYVSLQAKKADAANAGQLGMYNVLAIVTSDHRRNEGIAHALAVREAVAMNDYHRFFNLYVDAPNMAGYLMDPMVPAIRLRALRAICKAYRPNLPLEYVRQELKLKGKEGDAFIEKSGLVLVSTPKGVKVKAADVLVDTKNSDIVWALEDQSSLI